MTKKDVERLKKEARLRPREVAHLIADSYDEVVAYKFISILRDDFVGSNDIDCLKYFNRVLREECKYRG